MSNVDLQSLIASHRNRLNEEKGRLYSDVQQKSLRTDSLREGSKTVDIRNEKNSASGKPSIAELRREMSRQRDREIGVLGPGADLRPPSGVGVRDPYLEIKERKLAEERRYHQLPADQDLYKRRKHWDDDGDARQPNGPGRPPLGPGPPITAQRWEDDDLQLMQWAKGRTYSRAAQNGNRDNHKSPPSHLSPLKQEVSKGTARSISAPVLMGMAAIGVKESDVEKRNKQKQYAEELKAQIRTKTLAKQREKGVLSDVSGGESIQMRARPPQRSENSPPPPPLRDNRESQWKAEGRAAQEPPHRRWSPHEDHPEYRRHPYSPPDLYNPPGHHHSHPGDHHYPGPSYHYPTVPSDSHYPYPPQYPPYMYRPEYSAFAPPPWPPPFYPPALHPPHTYGPNPYYPPSFPNDSYIPPHRQQSDDEGRQMQDSQRGERDRDGRQGNGQQQLGIPGANGKDPKKDKSTYRSQLKQQMEEKKEKDEHSKAKTVEVQEYNPWGKGGGGAPMRDEHGRLVADLRKMRLVNNEKLLKSSLTSPRGENTVPSDKKPFLNTEASPIKENGPVVATLVLEENNQQQGLEDYRESLRKQMEERDAIKKKEKEAKKLEDLKELERIKNEQDRIAENYKREQEMARKREVDARARNALLKKEAEDKRAVETSKKLEDASGNRAHQNLDQMSAQFAALDSSIGDGQQYRASSPPVPALKHLLHQQKGFSQLPPSPPSLQQAPPRSQLSQIAPSPPPPPVQRAPSPPVPALRKKLQPDPNQNTQNQQGVPSLLENAVPKPLQSTNPPLLSEFNQRRPSEPQAPTSQQDSAKLLRELSAIKRHLQGEHAKLAAKMLPIHRTEGAGSQASGPSNLPSLMSRFGGVNQNGLTQQPPYLPSSQQPSYLPSTQQPSYLPSTQQPSYLPSTQQPYLPHTQHTIPNSLLQPSGSRLAAAAAAVNTRTLAEDLEDTSQEPKGPLLTSESKQFPIAEQVNSTNPPPKPRSRRQWETLEPRQPSALSSASVTTFDLDAIAAQNEERQRRLEAILNAGAPGDQYVGAHRDPQTVLQDFLNRTDKLQGNQKLRSRANNVQ